MLKKGKAVLQGNLRAIKRSYGMKSINVHADFDLEFLRSVPGVLSLDKTKDGATVKVENEKVAEDIFFNIAETGFARKFEIEEPSLHDIFIDKVGGENNE
ncbi:DUF4162 domain-containing protein [Pseudomonas sp. 2822-17]|uniref:ATP-binding protein DrrA1-3 family domain-containing protein n=1 Tax=Pseudomonas sp. 2822-17 TaxID=1712678 RepID=UPI0021146773|nr:DUF4162 domain-containing protein [Pseudomonas sp. 2822-17]